MLNVPWIKEVAGVAILLVGVWVASFVIGHDGNPISCPNGEPPGIDSESDRGQPSMAAARAAQRDLPKGERAVFNEYTGEFEGVDALTKAGTYGEVAVPEGLAYECNSDDEPTLVPLSEADPQAAEEEHRQMARLVPNGYELTGLVGDPASAAR